MNQKLCKKLRREAQKLTVGRPERLLVADFVNKRNGEKAVRLVNAFDTTRGAYRALKVAVK